MNKLKGQKYVKCNERMWFLVKYRSTKVLCFFLNFMLNYIVVFVMKLKKINEMFTSSIIFETLECPFWVCKKRVRKRTQS